MVNSESKSRLIKEYSQINSLIKKYQPLTFIVTLVFSFIDSSHEMGTSLIISFIVGLVFTFSIINSTKYYIVFFILILFSIIICLNLNGEFLLSGFYKIIFLGTSAVHYSFYSLINNWKREHYLSYDEAIKLLKIEKINRINAEKINANLNTSEKTTTVLLSIMINNILHTFIPGVGLFFQPFLSETLFKRVNYEEEYVDIYTRSKIKLLENLKKFLILSTIIFLIISFVTVCTTTLYNYKSWLFLLKSIFV